MANGRTNKNQELRVCEIRFDLKKTNGKGLGAKVCGRNE